MSAAARGRLVVGAAALGQRYGVAGGTPPTAEAVQVLLARASVADLAAVDTAPAYGDSEVLLGQHLPDELAVWTKTIAAEADRIDEGLGRSCERLRRSRIDCFQWHNWSAELLADAATVAVTDALRADERVGCLGATTYGVEDALAAVESGWFEVVQVEWNLLDQGVVDAVAPVASQRGVRLAVRSVLLQGLFAGVPVPTWLPALKPLIEQLTGLAKSWEMSLYQLAVRAALDHPAIDRVLVGVRGEDDLNALLAVADGPALTDTQRQAVKQSNQHGLSVLDPRGWGQRSAGDA